MDWDLELRNFVPCIHRKRIADLTMNNNVMGFVVLNNECPV